MLGTLFKLKGANVTKKNITKDLGASKKLRRTGYYGIYNEGLQNICKPSQYAKATSSVIRQESSLFSVDAVRPQTG